MILTRFKKADFYKLDEQTRRYNVTSSATEEQIESLESRPNIYTVRDEQKTYCIFGLTYHWKTRAEGWAILDKASGPHLRFITKAIKSMIKLHAPKRTECTVDLDFSQAHRWAKLLGFHLEAPVLEAYGRHGENCALYVRIAP